MSSKLSDLDAARLSIQEANRLSARMIVERDAATARAEAAIARTNEAQAKVEHWIARVGNCDDCGCVLAEESGEPARSCADCAAAEGARTRAARTVFKAALEWRAAMDAANACDLEAPPEVVDRYRRASDALRAALDAEQGETLGDLP